MPPVGRLFFLINEMLYYSLNEENFGKKGNVVTFYKISHKAGTGQYLSIVFPYTEKLFYVVGTYTYKINGSGKNRKEITKREYYKIIRFVILSGIERKPSYWAPPPNPYW